MKNFVKIVFVSGTLVISLFSTSALACNVKVAWESWLPYQAKENNKLVGLDMELAETILKTAGCTATFEELPWARQLKSAEDGSVDIVLAASKTKEREVFATFGEDYRNETVSIWGTTNSPVLKIKSVDDLKTLKEKTGVVLDNSYGDVVDAMIKANKNSFESAQNDEMNFKKLSGKRVGAILSDEFTGYSLIKSLGLKNVEKAEVSVSTAPVYMIVSKKSKVANLRDLLDKAIKGLKAKGDLDKIISKYRTSAK